MGQKEPLVQRNVCLKEFYIQLESTIPDTRMDTFERKQHCNVPCAINCQGTFIIEFH